MDGERLVLGGFSDAIYIAQQPTSEMCETAYQLVRLLGGVHLLKKPVTAMSQGQLRLMLVARSLVRKPEVLLLDEVTDGWTHGHAIPFWTRWNAPPSCLRWL